VSPSACRRRGVGLAPVAFMVLLACRAAAAEPGAAAVPAADDAAADGPQSFLEYDREIYPKCQSLMRGKRILVRNVHASRTIHYYMARTLAGKRQAGIIRGQLAPGAHEPLGCEKLDNLSQDWIILRATFGS